MNIENYKISCKIFRLVPFGLYMESSTREIFVHILIRDVWILEKRAEESYCGRFGLLESTIEYKVRFRKRGWERGGEKENKEGKEEKKIK